MYRYFFVKYTPNSSIDKQRNFFKSETLSKKRQEL